MSDLLFRRIHIHVGILLENLNFHSIRAASYYIYMYISFLHTHVTKQKNNTGSYNACVLVIVLFHQVFLGWHWLLHLFYYTRWRHVSEGFESHAWQVMHDTGQTATVSTFRCCCSSYYIFKEYWNYNNCEELWLVTTLYTVLMMILPDLRYTCVGQCSSISI